MNSSPIPRLNRRLMAVLRSAIKESNLPARAYSRIVIVARRIADWANADQIETPHLLEAIRVCVLPGSPGSLGRGRE